MTEFERIEKMIVEKGGREGAVFLARSSNLPENLLLAAFKNIPQELYREVMAQVKTKRAALERPLSYFFYGKPGRGKTLTAVEYYVHLFAAGIKRKPLVLTAMELEDYYRGRIELHRFQLSDVELSSWFTARGVQDESEVVPFSQLCRRYDLILVDDVTENEAEALDRLILQAYNTDTYLILTTNEETLAEILSPRAVSRLFECSVSVNFDDFPYLRRV